MGKAAMPYLIFVAWSNGGQGEHSIGTDVPFAYLVSEKHNIKAQLHRLERVIIVLGVQGDHAVLPDVVCRGGLCLCEGGAVGVVCVIHKGSFVAGEVGHRAVQTRLGGIRTQPCGDVTHIACGEIPIGAIRVNFAKSPANGVGGRSGVDSDHCTCVARHDAHGIIVTVRTGKKLVVRLVRARGVALQVVVVYRAVLSIRRSVRGKTHTNGGRSLVIQRATRVVA